MNTYSPDGWVIVKITGSDPHYRVFGSFYGGFAEGDSWRMNSGITSCKFNDEIEWYEFKGHSGSIYYCSKRSYGKLSAYNQSVLDSYVKKSENMMEVMEDVEDWTKMDWIIK